MKITKRQLTQIIKATILNEGLWDSFKSKVSGYKDALSSTYKDSETWIRLTDEVLVNLKANDFYKNAPGIEKTQGLNPRLDSAIIQGIQSVVANNKEIISGLEGYQKQADLADSLGSEYISNLAGNITNPEIIILGMLSTRSRNPYFIKYMALNYQRLTLSLGDALPNQWYAGTSQGDMSDSPLGAEMQLRKMIGEVILKELYKD
jgi:hypothetical protein